MNLIESNISEFFEYNFNELLSNIDTYNNIQEFNNASRNHRYLSIQLSKSTINPFNMTVLKDKFTRESSYLEYLAAISNLNSRASLSDLEYSKLLDDLVDLDPKLLFDEDPYDRDRLIDIASIFNENDVSNIANLHRYIVSNVLNIWVDDNDKHLSNNIVLLINKYIEYCNSLEFDSYLDKIVFFAKLSSKFDRYDLNSAYRKVFNDNDLINILTNKHYKSDNILSQGSYCYNHRVYYKDSSTTIKKLIESNFDNSSVDRAIKLGAFECLGSYYEDNDFNRKLPIEYQLHFIQIQVLKNSTIVNGELGIDYKLGSTLTNILENINEVNLQDYPLLNIYYNQNFSNKSLDKINKPKISYPNHIKKDVYGILQNWKSSGDISFLNYALDSYYQDLKENKKLDSDQLFEVYDYFVSFISSAIISKEEVKLDKKDIGEIGL